METYLNSLFAIAENIYEVFVEVIRTKQSCQRFLNSPLHWDPSHVLVLKYVYLNSFFYAFILFLLLKRFFSLWLQFFIKKKKKKKHCCYLIKINKMSLIQSKDISLRLSRTEVPTFDLVIFFFFQCSQNT